MSLEKLEQTFRDVLAIDDGASLHECRYGATDGWTSLAHMQLVAELEEVFDVELAPEEIGQMSDFASVQAVLSRHGVALGA